MECLWRWDWPKAALVLSPEQRERAPDPAVGIDRSPRPGRRSACRLQFKLSNDPFFVEKVRDIVRLYLDPPEHAVVLCVDEKSQIQALERRWGSDICRGCNARLPAAWNGDAVRGAEAAKGTVISRRRRRHRHQEYLDHSEFTRNP
jgi:hypothetical protein